ncbi:13114_t:CDS:2, partial [Racocetra fulgida]
DYVDYDFEYCFGSERLDNAENREAGNHYWFVEARNYNIGNYNYFEFGDYRVDYVDYVEYEVDKMKDYEQDEAGNYNERLDNAENHKQDEARNRNCFVEAQTIRLGT